MIYKKIKVDGIPLEVTFLGLEPNPEMGYLKSSPVMVVVPGGGYEFVSYREAEPVALRYLSEGFNCFIFKYSIKKTYPIPHLELARLMNYVYEHAEEFYCDKTKISIMGFSAGGHLVSSYGYTYPEQAETLGIKPEHIRPFSITACYPVITSIKEHTHWGSLKTITSLDPDLLEKMSVEKHITKDYPPTFIWNTKNDDCVPTYCSECFDQALTKANVKHEYVSYKKGPHGLSLSNRLVYVWPEPYETIKETYSWVEKDVDFIYRLMGKQ